MLLRFSLHSRLCYFVRLHFCSIFLAIIRCWCDNDYGGLGRAPDGRTDDTATTPAADSTDAVGCNMPCAGDATQWCGGAWRNSVYMARGHGLTLVDGLVAKYSFENPDNPVSTIHRLLVQTSSCFQQRYSSFSIYTTTLALACDSPPQLVPLHVNLSALLV